MADISEKSKYTTKWTALDGQFQIWKGLFQDITDYMLPEHGNYLNRGKPDSAANIDRFGNILNDVGSRANQILGAGMQGGLTSPSRRWFKLTLSDKDLADFRPVKEWLHFAERVLYGIYTDSNFYTETQTVYESEGGFGTAVLFQDESLNTVVTFRNFEIGEYRLALGADGLVDTCYREFWMTAKQMVEMFGNNVSATVANQVKDNSGPYQYHQVLHVLEPRKVRNPGKIDSPNKPYASIWIEKDGDDGQPLRNSGYDERPFVAPRWRKVGQNPYGFGPGMYARGNVKMVQEMEKTGIKALHRETDPPLSIPSQFKDIVSLLPGAANYRTGGTNEKIEAILNVKMDLKALDFKIQQQEQRIERTFFNDLFMIIINAERAGRDVTATEILGRKEEKLLLLGPSIERQIKDFLDPTIERTFNVAFKKNLLPPIPEELIDQTWEVEYKGVLAQAQKIADAQSLNTYLTEVERIALLDPDSIHKTNFEEYLEQFADIVGIPPDVIRTKDEYAEIRAQLAQLEQQQAQQEQQAATAVNMKNMGSASTQEGTALGDVKEAVGG